MKDCYTDFIVNNKETRGEGDCFFHAAFGSIWNEQIADKEHRAHRQYLMNSIKQHLDGFLTTPYTRNYLIHIAWDLWINRWKDLLDPEHKKMEEIYNQDSALINQVINKYQEFSKPSNDDYYAVFLNTSGDEVKSILMQAIQEKIADLAGYKSALIIILNSKENEFFEVKEKLKACKGWFDFIQSNQFAMECDANKSVMMFFDELPIKVQKSFCELTLDFYSCPGIYINYHFSALMPLIFPEQFPKGFILARNQADNVVYEWYTLNKTYECLDDDWAHIYFNGVNHYEQTQDYSPDNQITYKYSEAQPEWLYAQLDNYYDTFLRKGSAEYLNEKGKEQLYTGVQYYQKTQGVNQKDSTYHRKLFIDYIVNLVEKKSKYCKETPQKIHQNPEKYAIDAEVFLGSAGLKLYMNALKEELHSKHYREAVFNQSVIFRSGQTLEKPPMLIIGGPSAGGKSTVVQSVIDDVVMKLPKKDDNNNEGNFIVAIDGGICREVSQMRKLLIRAANRLGYPGIKDLYQKSLILEKVKDYIKSTAFSNEQLGLLIPETYSNSTLFFKSGVKIEIDKAEIDKFSKDKELIFAYMRGKDPDKFKTTVYYLSKKQAWKTEKINEEPLDLNSIENLIESKPYDPNKFSMGTEAAKNLEDYYRKKNKNKPIFTLDIINDSSVKKKNNGLIFETDINLDINDALKKELETSEVKEQERVKQEKVKQEKVRQEKVKQEKIFRSAESLFSDVRAGSTSLYIFKQLRQTISEYRHEEGNENLGAEGDENIVDKGHENIAEQDEGRLACVNTTSKRMSYSW